MNNNDSTISFSIYLRQIHCSSFEVTINLKQTTRNYAFFDLFMKHDRCHWRTQDSFTVIHDLKTVFSITCLQGKLTRARIADLFSSPFHSDRYLYPRDMCILAHISLVLCVKSTYHVAPLSEQYFISIRTGICIAPNDPARTRVMILWLTIVKQKVDSHEKKKPWRTFYWFVKQRKGSLFRPKHQVGPRPESFFAYIIL